MKQGETSVGAANIDSLVEEVTKAKQVIKKLENKEKKIRSQPL
jgi:hypothetical protein